MIKRDSSQTRITPKQAAPIDLEIRVSLRDGGLHYTLHSPSGAAGYSFKEIPGQPLEGSPEAFRASLMERLEKLHKGYGTDDEELLLREAVAELEHLGRWLYDQLFPPELQAAYRKFRGVVKTLQITSDEPWIPWELVKPSDAGDPAAIIDDDFLCMQFELTRWLAGDAAPSAAVAVDRLAVFEVGKPRKGVALPAATKERERVTGLAEDHQDLEDVSPKTPNFTELEVLLRDGHLGLLHFAGHGDYAADQPDESPIVLTDRPFRPMHLSDPQLRARLRQDRPLVFLNACRAAQQGWSLTGLGGWADAWVRDCGCGAFIAPQWKVSDRLAHTFADTFYTALEEGQTFGQATRTARRALRDAEPGLPTWLAYSIYAHPNGHLFLGTDDPRLLRYVPSARGAPSEIRKHVIDDSGLIEEKTQGFVGRRWVFDLIDRFVAKEPRGYFLLLGDPGIGKTALMAEQVKRGGHVHHFNIRTDGINRPDTFLANICAQLIATYDLDHSFLPPEATADARFFKRLLEQVSAKLRDEGGKAVLLVDALDEADEALLPDGANPLFLPSTLPTGIYVVATSRRPSDHDSRPLRIDCEQQTFELEQDAGGNLDDVEEYVENRVEMPGIRRYLDNQGLDDEVFVAEMVEKSQGNFMYLHYVLPAIAEGVYQDRDFATLPVGLKSYYQDNWQLIRKRNEEIWFEYKLPVLVALTIVREPVSIDLIQDFSSVKRRSRVREVLDEWIQFLYATEATDDDGRPQKRYRIYHASFQDFVAAKDEVADERVDLKAAHGMIADVLWDDMYPDG